MSDLHAQIRDAILADPRTVSAIARDAGLDRLTVVHFMDGSNVKIRTIAAMLKALGLNVLVVAPREYSCPQYARVGD